jgi:tetratricopeptide (TPR) repeat protein
VISSEQRAGPRPVLGCPIVQIDQQLRQAQELYAQRQFSGAEEILRQVLDSQPDCREALEHMSIVCLQTGRPEEAGQYLQALVTAYPLESLYRDRLATVLLTLGRPDEAANTYYSLLEAHPEYTDIRFNLARLLKRAGRPEEALEQYRRCLRDGISGPEEVHTNISVILSGLHRHAEAEQALQKALDIAPAYAPAVYNLGLLLEEKGRWEEARGLFQSLLKQDTGHVDAMVRLAFGERYSAPSAPLVEDMKQAVELDSTGPLARENLAYALGKIHDDCSQYNEAFAWYARANQLSRARVGAYRRDELEARVDSLIAICDGDWLGNIEPVSDAAPLFICGMFRSGSTLLEQVLAAHPAVTAGGEIDYFPRRLAAMSGDYPALLASLSAQDMKSLGVNYLSMLEEAFGTLVVTNKRPDNFLYLGLIRALYPNARIVHTRRDPLDNSLSVFFQPLESALDYANDLQSIGHYYLQYRRLMDHWRTVLRPSVMDVDYEQLVSEPEPVIGTVLDFLGLEWDDACLRFYESDNRVRTASVSQVREPLYQRSAGRWNNYSTQLEPLRELLQGS